MEKQRIMQAFRDGTRVIVTVTQDDGWFLISGFINKIEANYAVIATDEGNKGAYFNEISKVQKEEKS